MNARALILAQIELRGRRNRTFAPGLFREPAWDILLDLALARIDHKRVSVTDACIASGVPPTTAPRHIGVLEQAGLARREPDRDDSRRFWLLITDEAFDAVLVSVGAAMPVASAA